MAKELFMTQWFPKEMVVAGETLIKRLDESDAQVQAAFWLLDDNEKTWELTIVSPLVESEGPRNYYKRINDINEPSHAEEEMISLHDIRVSDTNNRFFKAFLSIKDTVLWKEGAWLNKRLGKNYIGGVYFDDMYIYRMDGELSENTIPGITKEKTATQLSP